MHITRSPRLHAFRVGAAVVLALVLAQGEFGPREPAAVQLAAVTEEGTDAVPEVVLDAYHRAETALAADRPGCGLTWWMLAGIGKVESDHAEGGRVDADGRTLGVIQGPPLDGTNGTAAIADSAGTSAWERAVGPMQFLPSTWAVYGAGGDPNDIDDAATAAGRYLCAGGADLSDPAALAAAVHRYNPSSSYVATVLEWDRTYASGVTPTASGLTPARGVGAADAAQTAAVAVAFATAQVGLPYVWGGNGPARGDAGFDCSGLTHAAYAAAGVGIPRTAQTQYDAAPRLPADAVLQAGDLVFYGSPGRVHHVGLYVADGKMINAPTFGEPVQLAPYRWSGDDYLAAGRPAARPGSLPLVLSATGPARSGVPRPAASPARPTVPVAVVPATTTASATAATPPATTTPAPAVILPPAPTPPSPTPPTTVSPPAGPTRPAPPTVTPPTPPSVTQPTITPPAPPTITPPAPPTVPTPKPPVPVPTVPATALPGTTVQVDPVRPRAVRRQPPVVPVDPPAVAPQNPSATTGPLMGFPPGTVLVRDPRTGRLVVLVAPR